LLRFCHALFLFHWRNFNFIITSSTSPCRASYTLLRPREFREPFLQSLPGRDPLIHQFILFLRTYIYPRSDQSFGYLVLLLFSGFLQAVSTLLILSFSGTLATSLLL